MTKTRTPPGIISVLAGILLGLLPVRAASQAGIPKETLPAEVLGWKTSRPDQTYDRTTLGLYMPGGEDIFLAYDFRRLVSREYARPTFPRLTAEIYEMGSPEEAFGLFTFERQASPEEVGNEGLSGARFIQFWKGRVFVRVQTGREMPEAQKAMSALAQAIASALPPGGRKPLIVTCLPVLDLVPGRLSYFHLPSTLERFKFPGDVAALDLGPRTEAVLAEYRREGKPLEALVCLYPTAEAAETALTSVLKAYFGAGPARPGEVVAKRLAPGRFAAVRLTGRTLILVFNAPDRGAAKTLSDQIQARTKDVMGS
jgi:hypothetical protein